MQEDESKIKWSQFLAGDNEAYCWIYKVYIQMLFRYGHSFTSDTELIKDCIQDVFTGLEDRYTSYNHETVSFTLGLTVEEQYVTDELYTNQQRKIQEILNVLTPRQKEIIYYRYIQELSFDEICIMMDMNYQSAQNLIQRSLKKIRDLYGYSSCSYPFPSNKKNKKSLLPVSIKWKRPCPLL